MMRMRLTPPIIKSPTPGGRKPLTRTRRESDELQQQAQVVKWLRSYGYCLAAVPNGHVRSKWQNITGAMEGVSAGMPDLLIFDPPPSLPGCVGVALEMKRLHGGSTDVRDTQRLWLSRLAARGWVPLVGYGAPDAMAQLQVLGFCAESVLDSSRINHPRRVQRIIRLVERGAKPTEFLFGGAIGEPEEGEE